MDIEDPSSICSNCGKNIPEDKLMVHEAYCFRNFFKCSQCEEMIDKNQKTEHQDEVHNQINCKHCNQLFDPQNLKNHELFCEKKPKLCNFCNLEISFKDYSEHVYNCSSRTQQCEICQKFITRRDYEDHLFKCFQKKHTYEEEYPALNVEEKKNESSNIPEENKNEDVHKKKLESPKLPDNRSPALKKRGSKTQHQDSNEYNVYWDDQDQIHQDQGYSGQPYPGEVQHFDSMENNILVPNLPLTNTTSTMSNEDPELQRILYESYAKKN